MKERLGLEIERKGWCFKPAALAVSAKKSYISVNLRSHTIRIESGPLGTRSFLLPQRAVRAGEAAWNRHQETGPATRSANRTELNGPNLRRIKGKI